MNISDMSTSELEDFVNSGGLMSIPLTVAAEATGTAPVATQFVEPSETIASTTASASTATSGSTSTTDSATSEQPSVDPVIDHPTALDILDPLELLLALDEDIREGRVQLAKWQLTMLMDFASGGQSEKAPLQQILCAANGSGKDKYIIAPCVVWLCMRYPDARAVVTSSSGQQLDSQTCTYIGMLCKSANAIFKPLFGGKDCWKINYRYYECLVTNSFIDAYATDEPGKAEGYHPVKHNARMAIFVSEDKSVPDEINTALERCSGFTHRVHVSTPGSPMGHFYDYFQLAVRRDEIKSVNDVKPFDWISYHVTAYDCPHIPPARIEYLKRTLPGGESGHLFGSIVLAKFGSTDQMVVIPYHYVWKGVNGSPLGWKNKVHNDAGLDLSDGGDETVLAIRNGNKLLHLIPFRFDNTEDTVAFLNEEFLRYNLNHPSARINGDCGGMGKPILDRLKRMGWSNIHYIDNRHRPSQPRVYLNVAAELWFRFRELLELNEINLLNDEKLKRQLSTRFYSITPENKIKLESKLQARSHGHPSPDRADAVILAFWEYDKVTRETAPRVIIEDGLKNATPLPRFSMREFAKREEETRHSLRPSKKFDHRAIHGAIAEHNNLIRTIESTE